MEIIFRVITVLSTLFTLGVTVRMLISSRKERRIRASSLFMSVVLSLVMPPVFMLLSGARLNLWVGLPLLALGLLAGCVGGVITRLTYKDGQVIGKNSWLFLLLWGGSLVLAQVLNLFGSGILAALGLVPMFLTTGTQVGRDGTIFLRRLFIKPPPAVPSAGYTQPGSLPIPEQSRRIPPHFAEVKRRFTELRARYQAGEMDDAAYSAAQQGLMIYDGAGGYWLPGVESGEWYWHNGQEWVRRDPSSY